MRRVECELKARELTHYDIDADVIVVGGVEYRRCLSQEPKTYASSSGPVTVPRNLFRPRQGKAICPLDLRAGIIGALYAAVGAPDFVPDGAHDVDGHGGRIHRDGRRLGRLR